MYQQTSDFGYYEQNSEDSNSMAIEEGGDNNDMGAPADFNFKVIVVGNKRVGKTSITNRCVFDEFNENS